jgi:hypothetical protein
MTPDLIFTSDYDHKLQEAIDAERPQNADLSAESWKLLAQLTSRQVESKEANEYIHPRLEGMLVGTVVGGAVGASGALGVGALITAPVGATIGYGIGLAVGPSESSIEAGMPNDVRDAIGVIRSGKIYYKSP